MKFGDILKSVREDAGINQVELGEKIGISKQTISKYEKNEVLPSIPTLYDIADLFNCSIDYLLGRVPHKDMGVVEFDLDGKKLRAVVDKDTKKEIDNNNVEKMKELEQACLELLLENNKLKEQLKK